MLAEHASGLIATSACLGGPVANNFLHDRPDVARDYAGKLADIFGPDRFFIELQDHGLAEQVRVNGDLIALARALNLPIVATNDVHYCQQEDAPAQDILVCIQTNTTLNDPKRLKSESDQLFLKSPEEMARVFRDVPEAYQTRSESPRCARSILNFVATTCRSFPFHRGLLRIPTLNHSAEKASSERYGHVSGEVAARLAYELDVIKGMGFANYFLVVWDFIRFAREQGILVGPGRGSSAGSIVTYSLGITALDPLAYDLIFERFLNPSRISMPDIDIDFADDRRDEVIDYVVSKYGDDRVAQIVTFGTLGRESGGARRRARHGPLLCRNRPRRQADPGRTGHHDRRCADKGSGAADDLRERRGGSRADRRGAQGRGNLTSRVDARRRSRHLARPSRTARPTAARGGQERRRHHDPVSDGAARRARAAEDGLPRAADADGPWQGGHSFSRTLVTTYPWRPFRLRTPSRSSLLRRGETTGVFQLEGSTTSRMTVEVAPGQFDDLIALMALIRPGPMAMAPEYISRKHGRTPIEYVHPDVEPILRETYGVALYQEQVIRIANVLAGFSMSEGDGLRKAMGKKLPEQMTKYKDRFVSGCGERGIEKRLASEIFAMIERFAGYGFPKAHSAAYAVIAAQTALLEGELSGRVHGGIALVRAWQHRSHRRPDGGMPACRNRGLAAEHQSQRG